MQAILFEKDPKLRQEILLPDVTVPQAHMIAHDTDGMPPECRVNITGLCLHYNAIYSGEKYRNSDDYSNF